MNKGQDRSKRKLCTIKINSDCISKDFIIIDETFKKMRVQES